MKYTIAPDGLSITCHRCGMTSHSPDDVNYRYCGACHKFHDDRDALAIWTIYDHPRDYPGAFVARRYVINAGGLVATDELFTATTLQELRALLPPGLARFSRDPADDPAIVESWL